MSSTLSSNIFIRNAILTLLTYALGAIFITGCLYTSMSRCYRHKPTIKLKEWEISVYLYADLLHYYKSRSEFIKLYGHPPEEHFDYNLKVHVSVIDSIDAKLPIREKNQVRIDSVKIMFLGFSKTYVSSYVIRENEIIAIDSLHVPHDIQVVNATIYGTLGSLKFGFEQFRIHRVLKYYERIEKILKYD